MKKVLLSSLGLLAISGQAFAGNCAHNYGLLDKVMCDSGECVIFSATIKMDRNITATKVVRNHEVYADKNLRLVGNYGDDKTEYVTQVIRGGNSCKMEVRVPMSAFNLINEAFDSMVTPECRLTEVLTPGQQAVMGMYVTLINRDVEFACDQAEVADK